MLGLLFLATFPRDLIKNLIFPLSTHIPVCKEENHFHHRKDIFLITPSLWNASADQAGATFECRETLALFWEGLEKIFLGLEIFLSH